MDETHECEKEMREIAERGLHTLEQTAQWADFIAQIAALVPK